MAPIRVGVIGLSKSAKTSWASAAHFPYLIASNGKYEIKALCNSSKDAAQKAIEEYNLPASTKAYGDPQDLANDPDIDLVVCSTRVDVHYPTIRPSLVAGKDAFVEWPLASNAKDAEELTRLAKEKNVKTIVGLQGRVSPIYLKIKQVLESGKIGKVVSSSIALTGGINSRDSVPEGLAYFFNSKIGGNMFTIYGGHLSDSLSSVLGPIKLTASHLNVTRPNVKILSSSGKVLRTEKSDVPDRVHVEGSLDSHDGAPISIALRQGKPFKNTPALVWSILGEKGEVRLEALEQSGFQAFDVTVTIAVENAETGEVETVKWEDGMQERGYKGSAKNIGTLYELFARGKEGSWATFEDALEWHRFLEEAWGDWKA